MTKLIDFEDKVDLIDSPEVPENQKIRARELNDMRDAINLVHGLSVPVGSLLNFTGKTVPEGWLLCNGSAISRTTYSELFSVIGTTYGAGNGTTTFNLPNEPSPVSYSQVSSGVIQFKDHEPLLKVIIKAKINRIEVA